MGRAPHTKGFHIQGWMACDLIFTTQNSVQIKTYELFISGIFQLMFFKPRLTTGN